MGWGLTSPNIKISSPGEGKVGYVISSGGIFIKPKVIDIFKSIL
jgi:hypothetical protein